jgi:uncharacterized protein (DUF2252 family)
MRLILTGGSLRSIVGGSVGLSIPTGRAEGDRIADSEAARSAVSPRGSAGARGAALTDIDHTAEDTEVAVESTGDHREPEPADDASPDADDAGPASVTEESAPEAESAPAEAPPGNAPSPAVPSPAPKRARRTPRKPAAKGSTPRGARRSRAKVVPYLTPGERVAQGKATRAEVGRSVLGEWAPPPNRRDPVELLEEQAAPRVEELVPIRYGRMLVSPFTFFRGAAYLMASDLAGVPRTGLQVQLCGDAHLSNFGVYASPDRRLVFSVNDFDETLPGPFEWDLKRLVASFAVAGRDRGFGAKQRRAINLRASCAYRAAMKSFAGMDTLTEWYARIDVDDVVPLFAQRASKKQMKQVDRDVAKARTKDSLKAFAKLTHLVDGEPRITSDPPLIVPVEDIVQPSDHGGFDEFLHGLVRSYRETLPGDRRRLLERFRYVHAARKVVGVGSVGTRVWIVLLLGRDESSPLFLQVKEAEASVLEPFLGKSAFSHHGRRVVEGQQLTQAASDIMLGWLRMTDVDGVDRDFYVRQLWDSKGSAVIETMNPKTMANYAEVCGWALAKSHARSGDALAISSYVGASDALDRALSAFGETYADQNDLDYEALKAAAATGRVKAEQSPP